MNADVQLLVFENVNTETLLSFADMNQYFFDLAANVFKRVHSKKIIRIKNLYYETPLNAFNGGDIRDTDDEIIIQHFGTVLKVLKYFGNSMSHLSIDFYPNSEFAKNDSSIITLGKSINDHCSN